MKKPNQDYSSTNELAILLAQLQKEVKLSSITPNPSSNLSTTSTPTSIPSSTLSVPKSIEILKGYPRNNQLIPREILSPTLRPSVKARGLPVFDRSTHLVTSFLSSF